MGKPNLTVLDPEAPQSSPITAAPRAKGVAAPSEGWGLHIDAKKHFPGQAGFIAHHYCKGVAGGLTQCLLFDSDSPNARLVGVEAIVPTATYNTFGKDEKANWHYHKDEIPKVEATLPDVAAEDAGAIVKSIEETYGKIYLLWDPSKSDLPVGKPSVTVLK